MIDHGPALLGQFFHVPAVGEVIPLQRGELLPDAFRNGLPVSS
jgi:hypothetical protein